MGATRTTRYRASSSLHRSPGTASVLDEQAGRPTAPRGTSEDCAQKVALSPQAQEPEEFGFSMAKPEASRDSFQSMTAPER